LFKEKIFILPSHGLSRTFNPFVEVTLKLLPGDGSEINFVENRSFVSAFKEKRNKESNTKTILILVDVDQ
jgi:hypothetical protein